jgi:hypothetical protein
VLNGNGRVALDHELRDCVGDRVVETAVQRAELFDRERRVELDRQVGDGLAEIAVVVDDLVDGVAEVQELLAMGRGRHADLRQSRHVAARRSGDQDAFSVFAVFFRLKCPASAG